MKTKDTILHKIQVFTGSKYPDAEVYLYGSHARGDSHKLSDWDLLILLNQKNIPFDQETKVLNDFYELELEIGEVLSPLIYTKNDWINNHTFTPLYENILKEGKKIQ